MKSLIAEDDPTSNKLITKFMGAYGHCDSTFDGHEAVEAYKKALEGGELYDVICLDIMMPNLDGVGALEQIRSIESEHGIAGRDMVKIIMTTAIDEVSVVMKTFRVGCESYLVKPVNKKNLEVELQKLNLLAGENS